MNDICPGEKSSVIELLGCISACDYSNSVPSGRLERRVPPAALAAGVVAAARTPQQGIEP